jgi:hypothetical protein
MVVVPGALGVKVTVQVAVAPVPESVHGDPVIVPAAPVIVNVTVPVGVVGVADVSVTVTVHVVGLLIVTEDGVQDTVVVVV